MTCSGLIEPPDLPDYKAMCGSCPPELMGLDFLIRVLPVDDELLRGRLRRSVARAGKAYIHGNLGGAARGLTTFRTLVAQNAPSMPESSATTLDTLTVQIADALDIPLQREP